MHYLATLLQKLILLSGSFFGSVYFLEYLLGINVFHNLLDADDERKKKKK